jgi:hypothetical protein
MNLIQGTPPPAMSTHIPETQNILCTLARDQPKLFDNPSITPQDFKESYKVSKENTSSSPSGRHIGHYKAVVDDLVLADIHATMMSIPFQVRILPHRWKKVTDIMLEKSPGDSRCHRLQIIALFESDLNHAK